MKLFSTDKTSLLVNNMLHEVEVASVFPVLIGDEVAHFHDVSGGFNSKRGYHVVNFIHEVQGYGSPDRVGHAPTVEAHLPDNFYHLDVEEWRTIDEYPDENYVISLLIGDHKFGEFSFSEELTADIDKRETRYSNE